MLFVLGGGEAALGVKEELLLFFTLKLGAPPSAYSVVAGSPKGGFEFLVQRKLICHGSI